MKLRMIVAGVALAWGSQALANDAVQWKMASSFPKSLDTIYGGAELLSKRVADLTGGKFQIRVYPAGELVPGTQVLDAVQNSTVQAGHTAGYYYVGKNKALAFDTTLPFGLTARQQNAWWQFGGGKEAMAPLYAKYGIVGFPGGNTGAQMGGWFRKEVKSLNDLKGIKMRIPGIGGEIMSRLGVVPQTLAGGDIFPALEKGTIDATEWVGPYDDEKLGFYKVAKHYYYPGFWEPSATLSFYVNKKEWDKLPKPYQAAFETAAAEVNSAMLAAYDAKNPTALVTLLKKGVKLHRYPDDVMKAAQTEAFKLYDDEAKKNPDFARIYSGWKKFRQLEHGWHSVAEQANEQFLYSNRK
ncbi:TRAP transporter substrate-binding protein [Chitinibacteraceae bacterium HSL-7]